MKNKKLIISMIAIVAALILVLVIILSTLVRCNPDVSGDGTGDGTGDVSGDGSDEDGLDGGINNGTELSARQMEKLDRGLVAVKTLDGVALSWRLFGTESLSDQAFDIYRNGQKIHTTDGSAATFYIDADGSETDKYVVVPQNGSTSGQPPASVWTNYQRYTATDEASVSNSVAYLDILFDKPDGGTTPDGKDYTYTANDASVADLDGDGDYEIILKWDPSNSTDNTPGFTGNCIIDAYDVDFNTGEAERLWRVDLGVNIRAGAHHTQFLAYDFDGDGKAEVVFKTAPGTIDGTGEFVSEAGVSNEIKNTDNSAVYRSDKDGLVMDGPEYLTIFEGTTGKAMQTIPYYPARDIVEDWGDDYANRADRFLAAVAYLNGKTPSIVMCRGYYTYVYLAAYDWDGKNLKQVWFSASDEEKCTVTYPDGSTVTGEKTAYSQGNHNLATSDVDNDGKDEIVYGSAIIDDNGTVLSSTGRGHGDAMHVSDYDNDGVQEIYQVHEDGHGVAADLRKYDKTVGETVDLSVLYIYGDCGRGLIGNIDDEYASNNKDALAAYWCSHDNSGLYDLKGNEIGKRPTSNSRPFMNFTVYWDGDLGVELLDRNMIIKSTVDGSKRFNYNRTTSYFPNISTNNDSKDTPCLCADILGDWREEIIYRLSDGSGLRIYFSTIPTEYRLYTLMHDSQYRTGVAAQNVGYNQPAHTSYYIGSAALKTEGGNKLNYLSLATPYTKIYY